ncbi:MAG: ABC transporter ATP-binding protein [Anaerolineaceae bacterium]|nr:ABC transporter ATP-binding protein [Anaerolineaceae bacterium]
MDNKKTKYLEIKKLTKTYFDGKNQKRHVLKEMNAVFCEGQIVAILGKSGSGKSTLLNLISGIDVADSGEICLYGHDITRLDETALTTVRRNKIGFVFQFFNLLPNLTVWENVCLPLELKRSVSKVDYERAESLLEKVGMFERRSDFPDRLSGGEQQRVAIARALVHEPELVLADEPTGNLDRKNGEMVMRLLTELTRSRKGNLILVTHSKDAALFADRVCSIENGKLVEVNFDQVNELGD